MSPEESVGTVNRIEHRSAIVYATAIGVTIAVGLGSRKFGFLLPPTIRKPAGDVLWATMVFFLFGLLLPRFSSLRVAFVSIAFSVIIESSKFLHPAWLDILRDNPLGRLVFGYVFSWGNLVCYVLGIGLGLSVERGFLLRYPNNRFTRLHHGK